MKLDSVQARQAAENTALHLWTKIRGAYVRAQRRDRYDRAKAGVVALWLTLSVLALVVACPGSPSNSLGAELLISQSLRGPIYMVKNTSEKPWKNVTLVFNHRYRAATRRVEAGREFVLTPEELIGPNGTVGTNQLQISQLEVLTSAGHARIAYPGDATH